MPIEKAVLPSKIYSVYSPTLAISINISTMSLLDLPVSLTNIASLWWCCGVTLTCRLDLSSALTLLTETVSLIMCSYLGTLYGASQC